MADERIEALQGSEGWPILFDRMLALRAQFLNALVHSSINGDEAEIKFAAGRLNGVDIAIDAMKRIGE